MSKWFLKEIHLPLKFPWSISRSSTTTKTNFVVEYSSDEFNGKAEVAFNSRYGEDIDLISEQFGLFTYECPTHLTSGEELSAFLDDLDITPSLKCGIENAFVHFLANLMNQNVQEYLGLNTKRVAPTSFSLPVMKREDVGEFIQKYDLNRFSSLKIKLAGTKEDIKVIEEVSKHYKNPLRLDANEAYSDVQEAQALIEKALKLAKVEFLEQPFHASKLELYKELKGTIPVPLMADESFTNGRVTEDIKNYFDGVNIKLMKSGGYFNAIKQFRDAKEMGLLTMLGCMVETSLGISEALNICYGFDYYDLDGFLLIKEDPFGHVSEEQGNVLLMNGIS